MEGTITPVQETPYQNNVAYNPQNNADMTDMGDKPTSAQKASPHRDNDHVSITSSKKASTDPNDSYLKEI